MLSDYFFQIVLFFAGLFIGIVTPLLPKKGQKWVAGILSGLLIIVSLIWVGYELGVREILPPAIAGTTPDTPIPPTDTSTPVLSTDTPIPPTDTPTPVLSTDTPTSTSTPTPTCPPPVYFQDVWEMHPQLGCPTNALTSDFTFQTFEMGILAWQKSPNPPTIYAFYYDTHWERQTDPGGPPVPSCPEAEQTNGLGPIHSFGKLWCEPWNWKEHLGAPTDREIDGKNNQIQNFENGTILTIGEAGGFILYSNSQWEKF